MKTRVVLACLLVSILVTEVSAQRAEYDDMYFRAKDRERNKAIEAEKTYASAKTSKASKQKQDEIIPLEDDSSNPTDSYSARNVNPEYVSRSNSQNASEDESNYYLEGYTPASTGSTFTNSYYNNAALANNGYYASNLYNNRFFNRGYGCMYCGPQMNWMITSQPYYPYGFYDSWMNPYYSGYGSGLSMSFMYGNYWSPYASYGYPYSYYGGYGYPGYYTGGNTYYESPNTVNYGKRPSRHSAVVQPTERPVTRTRYTPTTNVVNTTNGTRQRQAQDEYYVRPSRRPSTSTGDSPVQWSNSNSGNSSNNLPTQHSSPSRSRDSYTPSSYTPSYSPSSTPSPSRGGSGSSGSGGGGSRPRGRD